MSAKDLLVNGLVDTGIAFCNDNRGALVVKLRSKACMMKESVSTG